MIYIFGTRCFGKVDHVPGQFYVATRFFHVNFVPLIPLGSYIIFEGTDRGKPIGLSLKSLALAWGRWMLIIAAVICGFLTLVHFGGGLSTHDAVLILIGCGLGLLCMLCAGLFIASFFLNKASRDRAMQMADELGWPRNRVARHFDANGARGEGDMLEAEPVRDYDRRRRDEDDRERDYDRRPRDREDDDRDYDRRRDREDDDRDYDRRDRDRDYDRRDY